jgi:hypothetical protein
MKPEGFTAYCHRSVADFGPNAVYVYDLLKNVLIGLARFWICLTFIAERALTDVCPFTRLPIRTCS